SLHDALPISLSGQHERYAVSAAGANPAGWTGLPRLWKISLNPWYFFPSGAILCSVLTPAKKDRNHIIHNEEVCMKTMSILIAIVTLSSACTWGKVNESGTSVAVANMANVRNSEKLRNVNVNVKSSVGRIDRNDDKVATELANLARNEAASFGGDTVVPTSAVENGSQSFGVYKCK